MTTARSGTVKLTGIVTQPPRNPRRLRALLRSPAAIACLTYLVVVVGIAIIAPLLLPGVVEEHAGDLLATQQGPSAAHLLGTDTLGRDVLARLLVGTRVAVIGVAEALVVVLAIGVPLGLVAGYFGGTLDRVVGWLADLTFAMPAIIIIMVVLSVYPQSMTAAMVTFGIIAGPGLMRIVRSATLPVRQELYIAAAQVSGLSRWYIIARHVLPRVAGPVIVQSSLLAAAALLVQSGLGFLTLVVPQPAPSWGGMVADGAQAMELQPWLIWPPGLAIAITVLALGLLGDSVRDATTAAWSRPMRQDRARRSTRPLVASEEIQSCRRDSDDLLAVDGLRIAFATGKQSTTVVDDVSFTVRAGETVGIVGESGCGKTLTAMSILGLLPGTAYIDTGRILFDGRDLAGMSERELRRVRGKQIGLVSQEPMVALNPAFRIGWQLAEAVRRQDRKSVV